MDEYEEIRRRTLQREIFVSLPVHANKKDGSNMQISYSTAPVIDEENHIIGTVAIFYDITEKMELETALKASLEKMRRVVDETVEALASAVETRDRYTASHQRRVASLACAIAGEMGGIGADQMKGLRTAAVIHDIGKLYVPFELLDKPGRLNDIEFAMIKTHPQTVMTF
jgi:HD-GYP domain-containing protein (c-di-GMP phosphodiesterase class II)